MHRISDVFIDWLDASETPVIKIRGAYLERFGFPVGTNLKVDIQQNSIIITPISGDISDIED
jgi:hypothetical protein